MSLLRNWIGLFFVNTFPDLTPPMYRPGAGFRQGAGPVTYIQKPDTLPGHQEGNNAADVSVPQGPMLAPGSSVVTPDRYNDPHAHERKAGDKIYGPYPPHQNVDLEYVNVVPIDATYANNLNQFVNHSNDQYRAYVEVAKAKNPGINPVIFDDIQKHNKELIPWYVGVRAALNKVNPNGDPPSEEAVNPKIAELHKEWYNTIYTRVIKDNRERNPNDFAKADSQVNMAFNAVNQALPDGENGILSSITKSIYNKEKGGIQLGGVGGALAGLVIASVVTGGQGFFGFIAAIMMTAAGAYFGNMIIGSDEKSTSFNPPASGAGKEKEGGKGTGPEQQQQQGHNPQQQQKDKSEQRVIVNNGEDVNSATAKNLAGKVTLAATGGGTVQNDNSNITPSATPTGIQTAGTGKKCNGMAADCW